MYRKSFFLVVMVVCLIGLMASGMQLVNAIPGFSARPSAYAPKISVEEAVKTSQTPLLIEFYTDTCNTCQVISPWVHKIGEKHKTRFTLVMVNLEDPGQAQIADIFGVQYVPVLFVFDFKHMVKSQVDIATYGSYRRLEQGILEAAQTVEAKAAQKKTSRRRGTPAA